MSWEVTGSFCKTSPKNAVKLPNIFDDDSAEESMSSTTSMERVEVEQFRFRGGLTRMKLADADKMPTALLSVITTCKERVVCAVPK